MQAGAVQMRTLNSSRIVLFVLFLMVFPALAHGATSVSFIPVSGPPTVTVAVTGAGFGASEAVDLYFDTTDTVLGVSDSSGGFSQSCKVPRAAEPGSHWI